MNVKSVEKENGKAKVVVEIDKPEFEQALNKAYAKCRKDIMLPGFRKGKAPRKMVESMYGATVFYEDAVNEIFPEIYTTAIVDQQLKAVGSPSVSNMDTPDEGGVVLTIETELYPEVTLGQYKGIEVPKREVKVEESEVDAEVNRMAERNARIETVDRAAQMGDTVVIDFEGFEGGKPFQGGKAEDYSLTLGSGSFIPGFEEQVVGMNAGEKKDVSVKFPENYQAEELKGKDAVFAVTLNSIQGKELPELTDAFIKDATGSETIEEYKEKTKERLQKQADKNSLDATENSILDAVSATAEAEIPDAMIEREIDNLVQKFEYQLMYQGLKLQDYLDFIKVPLAEFRKNYEEQAKKNVLNQLVISQIIKEEKIEATDEEVEEKVAEQAASVDKSAEEYKKDMDPRQYDYIKSDIIITKLFNFLKANNEMYVEENKE